MSRPKATGRPPYIHEQVATMSSRCLRPVSPLFSIPIVHKPRPEHCVVRYNWSRIFRSFHSIPSFSLKISKRSGRKRRRWRRERKRKRKKDLEGGRSRGGGGAEARVTRIPRGAKDRWTRREKEGARRAREEGGAAWRSKKGAAATRSLGRGS